MKRKFHVSATKGFNDAEDLKLEATKPIEGTWTRDADGVKFNIADVPITADVGEKREKLLLKGGGELWARNFLLRQGNDFAAKLVGEWERVEGLEKHTMIVDAEGKVKVVMPTDVTSYSFHIDSSVSPITFVMETSETLHTAKGHVEAPHYERLLIEFESQDILRLGKPQFDKVIEWKSVLTQQIWRRVQKK